MNVVRRRLGAGVVASLTLIAMSFAVLIPTAFAARPKCFGRTATQVGSGGDNEIHGTARTDVIVARGGSDLIFTGKGKDYICAGSGDIDFIFSGPGNDKVKGQGGDDAIFPGAGTDDLNGGPGEDFVTYEGSPVSVVGENRNIFT